ncbi:hypothetical protein VSDG_02954 [Cytospora chrysosperma]|uniref:Uncharacterized protein n=1 Tax=Cytospora chrysosperma TaxID=252740 RepID=A0A423W8Y4_CYTCH|nr:hypothetical protein VSDG_02954 [Valsa sordida]
MAPGAMNRVCPPQNSVAPRMGSPGDPGIPTDLMRRPKQRVPVGHSFVIRPDMVDVITGETYSVRIREFSDRSGVTTCFAKISGLGCIVTVIGTLDSMRCVLNLMEMIINEEVDKRAACAGLVSTNVESVMSSEPHPSAHPLTATNELPKAIAITPIQSGTSTPTSDCLVMANQLHEAVPTPTGAIKNEDPSDRPDAAGRVLMGRSGRPKFETEPEAFKNMSREDRKILCRASNMRFMTEKGPAPRVKRRPYE